MSQTGAPFPGTFTDVVKALRELLALLGDVGDIVARGATVLDNKRKRSSARSLANLRFRPAGFLASLRAIANGDGNEDHVTQLKNHLQATEAGITAALTELDRLYDPVREEYGIAVADWLDRLLQSEGDGRTFSGKRFIRNGIERLIRDYEASGEGLEISARDLLDDVANFNKEIGEFHDMLLGLADSKKSGS